MMIFHDMEVKRVAELLELHYNTQDVPSQELRFQFLASIFNNLSSATIITKIISK